MLLVAFGLDAQTARLQVIHNSPSPTVDIWVNGTPWETDFSFREALEFRDVPAGVLLEIGIAPSPSSSPNDIIATFPVTLMDGETYVAIANGIVGDANTPFGLELHAGARESSTDPDQVDLLVFHGSPDAPNVDVDARNVATIVDELAFGAFTDYISVPAAEYTLDIRPAGDPTVVATYAADVTGLAGQSVVVFASGFLGQEPGFGLFAALPNGDVVALPAITDARVQIIHNSPEPTVDIWVNDQPFLIGVDFRTATPFVDVPANTDLSIGIAPSPSTSPTDIIYTLSANFLAGETYIAMANGVVGDMMTPFNIAVFDQARETASGPTDVDLLVFHGSPDAPTVDVTVGSSQMPIVDNLEYGTFQGYLNVPAADYTLNITPENDNSTNLFSYDANITTLAGGSATIFASGFIGSEPGFGLWVALVDGTTFPLSITTSTTNPVLGELAIWPNPVRDQINIVSNASADTRVILTLMDMHGRPIQSQTQILGPSSGQVQLSASQLASGIYYLQLQPDHGTPSTLTIIKQ